MRAWSLFILGLTLAGCQTQPSVESVPVSSDAVAQIYANHCASCHGATRWGVMGPALLPETLSRLKKSEAIRVIRDGRPATQMPGFHDQLSEREVAALADWIYTPVQGTFSWGPKEIAASLRVVAAEGKPVSRPVFAADPLNLFFVVSHGDHQLSVLDGDQFEIIKSFKMRPGLHGGVKYTPDGRYAFTITRDGWLTKFDVWGLRMMGEVRVGINARNLAISGDGHWVAVANTLPGSVVILNADTLATERYWPAESAGQSSRVSAVYSAPPRKSFVVALKDVPEIWEIPYARRGRQLEAFAVRRLSIAQPLDDFFFDAQYSHLLGASREGSGGFVVDLNRGQVVKQLALRGMPHLASGILWRWKGKTTVMATPNIKDGNVMVVDTKKWKIMDEIATLGPGFFLRSHENSPYAWVDNFMSPNKDTLQIIDKQALSVVRDLKPYPGKVTAHVEFTRDGKYALASVWEDDGAILVYDANSLNLVKAIPMKKPSGKYNVWNKTRLSEGTSH